MMYRLGERVVKHETSLKRLFLLAAVILIVGDIMVMNTTSTQTISLANTGTQAMLLSNAATNSTSTSTTFEHSGSGHTAGNLANSVNGAALDQHSENCNGLGTMINGLSHASSPELQKLDQYQEACGGNIFHRVSFFVPMPDSASVAPSYASDVAATLKDFAAFGIKPLVFLEPNSDSGALLDLNQYQAGAYDAALNSYFSSLKQDGITDAMMGMWVSLPEGDLPVWSTTDPNVFAADVTKTVQFQKQYFPGSQAAVLLDSESYAPGASWGQGQYASLVPYVQNIPKGLIDSFGLQGFPWGPPANQAEAAVYDPKAYLRIDFAAAAARALGISNIWFNTGTFTQMYTNNPSQLITMAPSQRLTELEGVINQAKLLQSQGFAVSIHLFDENKSSTSEAIDWSYWHTAPGQDANTAAFTTFAHDAIASNIPLWLFDTDQHD